MARNKSHSFLQWIELIINLYDPYFVNIIMDGKQVTISWHVEAFKVPCANTANQGEILNNKKGIKKNTD